MSEVGLSEEAGCGGVVAGVGVVAALVIVACCSLALLGKCSADWEETTDAYPDDLKTVEQSLRAAGFVDVTVHTRGHPELFADDDEQLSVLYQPQVPTVAELAKERNQISSTVWHRYPHKIYSITVGYTNPSALPSGTATETYDASDLTGMFGAQPTPSSKPPPLSFGSGFPGPTPLPPS